MRGRFCDTRPMRSGGFAAIAALLVPLVVPAAPPPTAAGAGAPANVVFEGSRDVRGVERWDLYVVHPDGSGFSRLPGKGRITGDPAWSREGSRLVFSSDRGASAPIR